MRVRYEEMTLWGEPRHEAVLQIGSFGFAGRGASRAEANAELLHRLKSHLAAIERAVDIVAEDEPREAAIEMSREEAQAETTMMHRRLLDRLAADLPK